MQDSSDFKLDNQEVKLLTTPRMRINWGLIVVLILLVSGGVALIFDKDGSQAKKDERSKKAADAFDYLDTEESRLVKAGEILPPGTGRIVPSNQHSWLKSASAAGTITYINENSSLINKDDILIKLENTELTEKAKRVELQVEAARSNLKFIENKKSGAEIKLFQAKIFQAQAECDKIEENIKLSVPFEGVTISSLELNALIKQKEIGQQQLTYQKEKLNQFTENVNIEFIQVQKSLKLLESELSGLNKLISKLIIKAPVDGKIIDVFVKIGEKVDLAEKLLTFYDPAYVNVKIAMSYANLPYFKLGRQARIFLESQPNKSYDGTVINILAMSNQTRNNFELIIKFDNPDELVLVGCTARIEFQKENK